MRARSVRKRNDVIRSAFNDERVLSRFVARDVKRQVKLVNIDEIESGFIVAQIKTTNILYLRNKLAEDQPFGSPQRLAIEEIWEWSGQPWGGQPDGTSIADHVELDSSSS